MNADQVVRNCLASYVKVKRIRCHESKGPTDVGPILQVGFDNGEWATAPQREREMIPELVTAIRIQRNGWPVAWLASLADVYAKDAIDPTEAAHLVDHGRGAAAARFHAGDFDAYEALSATVLTIHGEVSGAVMRYDYDDAGQPKFRQPRMQSGDVEGEVVDQLRKALGL